MLLQHPKAAAELARRIIAAEDAEDVITELLVLEALLDGARIDAEGRGNKGPALLDAVERSIEGRVGESRPGLSLLGRCYVRASLKPPERLKTSVREASIAASAGAAVPDLDDLISRMRDDARGDPYAFHAALSEMLATYDAEIQETLVRAILERFDPAFARLGCFWLLDPSPDVRRVAADAFFGHARQGRLDAATRSRLTRLRNWMPVDAARTTIDSTLRPRRTRAGKLAVRRTFRSPAAGKGRLRSNRRERKFPAQTRQTSESTDRGAEVAPVDAAEGSVAEGTRRKAAAPTEAQGTVKRKRAMAAQGVERAVDPSDSTASRYGPKDASGKASGRRARQKEASAHTAEGNVSAKPGTGMEPEAAPAAAPAARRRETENEAKRPRRGGTAAGQSANGKGGGAWAELSGDGVAGTSGTAAAASSPPEFLSFFRAPDAFALAQEAAEIGAAALRDVAMARSLPELVQAQLHCGRAASEIWVHQLRIAASIFLVPADPWWPSSDAFAASLPD